MKVEKFSLIVCVILFISLISSCKTSKKANTGTPPNRSQKEVVEAIEKRNIDFNWFTAKASGDFESPQFGGSGSMQLRIKKDSLIWMVGKKFSIEGFRTIINKDSFYVINRLERFYTAEPLHGIHKMFGMKMEFEDMQQLLAGNVFLPDINQIENYSQNNSQCTLLATIDGYNVKYVCSAYDLSLQELELKDRYGRKVKAMFDNYKKFNKSKIPYLRNYEFYDATSLIGKLEVDVDEIEIDVPKTMIFSIPSHYKRVRF